MMKGLVAVVGLVLLAGMGAYAGDLEMFAGAGPGGAALGEINAAITLYNAIIADLNETPTIDGTVPLIPHLGAGIGYYAGEQFWMTDSLAIGGKLEYFRTETSTSGATQAGMRRRRLRSISAARSLGSSSPGGSTSSPPG